MGMFLWCRWVRVGVNGILVAVQSDKRCPLSSKGTIIMLFMQSFEYYSNATVQIDPLDGTSEFTSGNIAAVTTLLGIAVDDLPWAGTIHQVRARDWERRVLKISLANRPGSNMP